jgi:23S rRNA pseudouridine2605 synthase
MAVHHPGHLVDPRRSVITVDGRVVRPQEERAYILLHKPVGCLSARKDKHGRRTVMSYIDRRWAPFVYPVGRLDWDVSGLLLLTNDGELAHRLTHPTYHVPRTYEVECEGLPGPEAIRQLAEGVELEDGVTAPARVRVHKLTPRASLLKVTLREGRKNQVKRMFEAAGHPVRSLRRIGFGSLHLGHMPPGSSRPLRPSELHALREAVGLADEDGADPVRAGPATAGGQSADRSRAREGRRGDTQRRGTT